MSSTHICCVPALCAVVESTVHMGQQSADKGDGIRCGLWLAARVHEDM